jgi:dihydrofolate reductase
MTVSLIAAVARGGVIGRSGTIPWRLPSDIAYFKRTTMGHPVIMGRKTMESIGGPLPGRTNIVVTRNPEYSLPGVITARSAEEALERATGTPAIDEVFVIGGAAIYALFLPMADRLYITEIDADIPGDERFPAFDKGEWERTRLDPGIVNAANSLPHGHGWPQGGARRDADALPHAFAVYRRIRR